MAEKRYNDQKVTFAQIPSQQKRSYVNFYVPRQKSMVGKVILFETIMILKAFKEADWTQTQHNVPRSCTRTVVSRDLYRKRPLMATRCRFVTNVCCCIVVVVLFLFFWSLAVSFFVFHSLTFKQFPVGVLKTDALSFTGTCVWEAEVKFDS